jgi:transcriptional regulator with PAS, ATPase and Fis domain
MRATRPVRLSPTPDAAGIVGDSEPIRRALFLVEQVAPTQLPVLLVGATGTGKELFAQYIHQLSGRTGDLVDVDCGALPREMLESLLFGHRRGAFTGALEDAEGLVSRAAGGTLFLDELSSLPAEGQGKLLRVLETGEVRRVGDTGKRRIEFRVVAAVQDDVMDRLGVGAFRADLYHRVAGAVVYLPPLRERGGDLFVLAAHFAAAQGHILGSGALAVLQGHAWPGNVRELRRVIQRSVMLAGSRELDGQVIAEALGTGPAFTGRSQPHEASAAASAKVELLGACAANGWDPGRIAIALGVSRATLYRRLREQGIRLRRISRSHQSHESHGD